MTAQKYIRLTLASLFLLVIAPAIGTADTLDFEGLDFVHGRIVSNQYSISHGVTISADNISNVIDLAIIFDSTYSGTTTDDDLLYDWDRGNLQGTPLGNMLIIAENATDTNPNDGIIDNPDDEGSRPAGSIYFDFDNPIISFGFDLIDVEGPEEYGRNGGWFAVFYDGLNKQTVSFADFIDPTSPYYQGLNFEYGNNSANRVAPITASDLNNPQISNFTSVEINFGGSAAIDNANYAVPIPAAIYLLGAGFIGLVGVRRRFKN